MDRIGESDMRWQVVTEVILTRIKGIIRFGYLRDVIVTSVDGRREVSRGRWVIGCSCDDCEEARGA